jgi:hypothetical protein
MEIIRLNAVETSRSSEILENLHQVSIYGGVMFLPRYRMTPSADATTKTAISNTVNWSTLLQRVLDQNPSSIPYLILFSSVVFLAWTAIEEVSYILITFVLPKNTNENYGRFIGVETTLDDKYVQNQQIMKLPIDQTTMKIVRHRRRPIESQSSL